MVVLQFACRTVFMRLLGESVLGINGVITNVLSMLSLAELGIGSAVVYCIYRPLAEGDTAKVAAYVGLYKNLYRIIAALMGVVGLALIPFLPYIIKTDIPSQTVLIYYLIHLVGNVTSYLYYYKTSIIYADQKGYIITWYQMGFRIGMYVLQLCLLLVVQSYAVYVLVQVVSTFICNFLTSRKAQKLYPYISEKQTLQKYEKRQIYNSIKSMFIYKVSGVLLTGTDNILISMIVGTITVGYYSNYFMVIAAVTSFTGLIFGSITASVGNMVVTESEERQLKVFNVSSFLAFWIFGFCSVCLFVLFNNFISGWAGSKMLLPMSAVFAIVLNFYISGVLYPCGVFRSGTGLFNKIKYSALATAVLNIVLSIIMGKLWGVTGILLATSIAQLAVNFWYEPRSLFKECFHTSARGYFIRQAIYAACTILAVAATWGICLLVPSVNLSWFIVKMAICTVVPNALFFLLFHRTSEFKYLVGIAKTGIEKITPKIKARLKK